FLSTSPSQAGSLTSRFIQQPTSLWPIPRWPAAASVRLMARTPRISVEERKRKKLQRRRQKKGRRQIFPIRRHLCSFRYSANNDTNFEVRTHPLIAGGFLLMAPQPTRFSLELVSDD